MSALLFFCRLWCLWVFGRLSGRIKGVEGSGSVKCQSKTYGSCGVLLERSDLGGVLFALLLLALLVGEAVGNGPLVLCRLQIFLLDLFLEETVVDFALKEDTYWSRGGCGSAPCPPRSEWRCSLRHGGAGHRPRRHRCCRRWKT